MNAFIWITLGIVFATLIGWLGRELHASGSWFARRITQRAAARLEPPMDEIRLEEWTAELDEMESLHILRMMRALGYWISALRITRERRAANARTHPVTELVIHRTIPLRVLSKALPRLLERPLFVRDGDEVSVTVGVFFTRGYTRGSAWVHAGRRTLPWVRRPFPWLKRR